MIKDLQEETVGSFYERVKIKLVKASNEDYFFMIIIWNKCIFYSTHSSLTLEPPLIMRNVTVRC